MPVVQAFSLTLDLVDQPLAPIGKLRHLLVAKSRTAKLSVDEVMGLC